MGKYYGAIKSVQLLSEGHEVAHAHLRYMRPFPKTKDILKNPL